MDKSQIAKLTETSQLSVRASSAIKAEVALAATMQNRDISPDELSEWAKELRSYPLEQIREAFAAQRRQSRYWPTVSEIHGLLNPPEKTPEFQVETSPCPCSKEELVALNGEFCEHGYAWGLAVLRNVILPTAEHKLHAKAMTEQELNQRREELKAQAKERA